MLTKEEKAKIVKDYARFEGDTGSVEVQVALLTATINKLTVHMQQNKKDFHLDHIHRILCILLYILNS